MPSYFAAFSMAKTLAKFAIHIDEMSSKNLVNDSRTVAPGDIFAAVFGTLADGSAYIKSAVAKGACLVIAQCQQSSEHGSQYSVTEQGNTATVINFFELNKQLALVSAYYYNEPFKNMNIIGVTGTNGKTSCCQLVAQLFTKNNHKTAIVGTLGAGTLDNLEEINNTTPGPTKLQQLLAEFNFANIENVAKGQLLAAHLSNRAFNQLRTEEQLGYAAGGFATQLGDHPMVGFYIQTPVKAPVAMLERFDRYRVEFASDLEALDSAEFDRIKAGVLTDLTQPPKNLAEEAGPFLMDWNRERYNFDTRTRLIAAVEQVTLKAVQDYYAETVMVEAPSRVLVQLKGSAFADEPFATIEGATVVENVSLFHEAMPLQAR